MPTTLRTSLIKLAYANPELRPRILPLLKEAASAKAMMRLRKLEDHLKSKGDTEGLELMGAFLDAMGLN